MDEGRWKMGRGRITVRLQPTDRKKSDIIWALAAYNFASVALFRQI